MRLLRDTHSFLWFVLQDAQLSATARAAIGDPQNVVELSAASYWEIAIKVSLGKYALSEPFQDFMDQQLAINRFSILPLEVKHAARLIGLPFHHKGPFDRMLVAQAMVEGIPIVSGDRALDAYPITRLC